MQKNYVQEIQDDVRARVLAYIVKHYDKALQIV